MISNITFLFFRKMIYKSFSVYRIVEAYTWGYMLVFLLRVTIVTIIKQLSTKLGIVIRTTITNHNKARTISKDE